jgi:hypothetical protein
MHHLCFRSSQPPLYFRATATPHRCVAMPRLCATVPELQEPCRPRVPLRKLSRCEESPRSTDAELIFHHDDPTGAVLLRSFPGPAPSSTTNAMPQSTKLALRLPPPPFLQLLTNVPPLLSSTVSHLLS